MRTLVIGSGANGMLATAALVESGHDVTTLVRPKRQPQLISARLKIGSPFGRFAAPVRAVTARELDGHFDVVIIATRANFYQMALFTARPVISHSTLIVPMFDGVHHLAYWRECYRENPVAFARFNVRASQDADGIVHQRGPNGNLQIGLMSDDGAERLGELTKALDGPRFRVFKNTDTLLAEVWARAAYRAAAAGTCQLSGTPLRDVQRFTNGKAFSEMLQEGGRAAEARSIRGALLIAQRYVTAFQREGVPVNAPEPIHHGGRAGSEALFLLANMLRQCQDAKVPAPMLMRAWEMVIGACSPQRTPL